MKEYKQPDFYHFSQDSIALAKFVINLGKDFDSICELCAGSGVISIEIARSLDINHIEYVELQKEFSDYIVDNHTKYLANTNYNLNIKSINEFNSNNKYDLVIANPPYFLPGKGRVSSNRNKQLCRTFEVDSYEILISKMRELKNKKAFFVSSLDLNLDGIKKRTDLVYEVL